MESLTLRAGEFSQHRGAMQGRGGQAGSSSGRAPQFPVLTPAIPKVRSHQRPPPPPQPRRKGLSPRSPGIRARS